MSLIEDDKGYQAFQAELGSPLRVARSHKYVFMLGSDFRGIALEEYTKNTPPGWAPYMNNYSLKLYKEKLALWLRTTDVENEKLGPTIVGRIKGAAYRIIMKMRVPRQPTPEHPDGYYVTADAGVAALAQPAIPAVEGYWDAQQGIQVHGRPGFPATPSGVDMIIQTLEAQYGELQTDLKGKALDRFFGLHRMNGSLHDYCTAYRIRYENIHS